MVGRVVKKQVGGTCLLSNVSFWANCKDQTAEVTPKCGLVKGITPECQNNSGLGIIVICADGLYDFLFDGFVFVVKVGWK